MNIKELESRLRQLEEEQDQQQQALAKLRDLPRIIEDENYVPYTDQVKDVKVANAPEEVNIKDIDVSELDSQTAAKHGYIICLMFNPNSPSEWSTEGGGGWRQKGGGTRYTDQAQLKEQYKKLKKQWPDYPLKVIKC